MVDRTGEIGTSKDGYTMSIVGYRSQHDIDVIIDDSYIVTNRTYMDFKCGKISSPYYKSVYGVGYLGVGTYKTKLCGKPTPQYTAWKSMLCRCYCQVSARRKKTYEGCKVCDEWHNFQVFAAWYDANYYQVAGEQMHLGKDLLVKGNKTYSPNTCVYVPRFINTLLLNKQTKRSWKSSCWG